jgi:hypothetical protein
LLLSSDTTQNPAELTWDDKTKDRLLKKLREEGLIGRAGPPAVSRHHFPSQPNPVWQATYVTAAGKRLYRRFSVAKHGEAQAKRLAEAAYLEMQAEHEPPKTRGWLFERLIDMPEKVLDAAIENMSLASDATLARALDVSAPTISKVRRRVLPLGPALLIRILIAGDFHIRELHAFAIAQS